jgi:MFS family permease
MEVNGSDVGAGADSTHLRGSNDAGSEAAVSSALPGALPNARRSRLPEMFRSLRHRNYRLFFMGQIISLIGTWMQSIAQSWLVYDLTGSTVLLGLVSFSGQFPVFLLATVGGAYADRHGKRKILLITQSLAMILALTLATLTLTGAIRVWHLFILAPLLGVVNAFDIPTRQAFVVEMVGKEDLPNAIVLNSSMVNGARIIGPSIAGVLVAAVGEGWCFFANGISYIAVLIGILMMRAIPQAKSRARGSAITNIVEGFRYVWGKKPVRSLLMLLGLVSLIGMPYAVLMPMFADRILHAGPRGLGMLMGSTGVGAMLGALSLAARRGIRGLGRRVMLSAMGFGAGLICFSFSHTFVLSASILAFVGFNMICELASTNTLIQSIVPDSLRGRAMAVYSMMFMGMAPFGALYAGALAKYIGVQWTVAIGGAVCIIAGALFATRLKLIAKEEERITDEMANGAAGGNGGIAVLPG